MKVNCMIQEKRTSLYFSNICEMWENIALILKNLTRINDKNFKTEFSGYFP